MDYLAIIARNLEQIRVAKGYTKDDLAGDANVSRTNLQNVIDGKNTTMATLAELARTLGVGLEHLVQPELDVVSVPLGEAADGVPSSTPIKVYVVRDKTSKRSLRPAIKD